MSTNTFKTLAELLRAGDPAAPAIGAPDRKTMTRGELLRLVEQTGGALRSARRRAQRRGGDRAAERSGDGGGLRRGGAAATAAPLNPAYRADEFEFYLRDLEAKALIVQGGARRRRARSRRGSASR